MKIKNTKPRHNQKAAVFVVLCTIVAIGAIVSYLYYTAREYGISPGIHPQQLTENGTAQTEQEASRYQEDQIEDIKEKTPPATDHTQNTPRDRGNTSVQIAAAVTLTNDSLIIRGGINNVIMTDGSTCFAELTSPKGEVTKYTTNLLRSATTTDCKTITIPRTQLSSGTWRITLHYSSQSTEGVSDAHTITIS